MIEYILLCVLFYLIGSIPTAFLILKFFSNKDITKEGSGNVGALNAFEVSKSKSAGIAVLLLDLLKGFLPSLFLYKILSLPFSYIVIPVSLLILGHNFSVWLKFRGGRGLATAAGISLAISPVLLLIWCIGFLISFLIYRKVHFGNIAATILLPVITFLAKDILKNFEILALNEFEIYFSFVVIISLLILLKHIKPFFELIKGLNH